VTLIVGIKCREGVILAADSGATLGDIPSGLSTIIQPVAKLEVVRGKAIIGVSGPVGLGQLYSDCLNRIEPQLQHLDTPAACRKLRDEFIKDTKIALGMAEIAKRAIGAQVALGVITSTLIAAAPKNIPELIQLDFQGTPEVATTSLPCMCIGSGQIIADPFLAFLRRLLWEKSRTPTIPEAEFAAVWTILHAINVAPAGLALPIRLAELRIEGGQPQARQVPEAVSEHLNFVPKAEEHVAKLRQILLPTGAEPSPPPIPQPPKK
jgi:ATP-dependent protease HslVU (ClpYQ) peptidase subunit